MTLDVTVGKVIYSYKENRFEFSVKCCPKSKKQVCKKKHTLWPKESYRSGSSGFWEFFKLRSKILSKIYRNMRDYPDSNDFDVAPLVPFISEIMSIPESSFIEEIDKDRLIWLKYWCKKAVDLYGNDAAIMFS